jgi:transaldolase/glucose-6-phosphate isomerase
MKTNLGNLQKQVDETLKRAEKDNLLSRLWDHDFTLWSDKPDEITNRLDWLELPQTMLPKIDEIQKVVKSVIDDGYTQFVLLGMGGSSLAPDVFGKIFGTAPGYLKTSVLDTTDAGAVLAYQEKLDLEKTLFCVSTKSGGTVETLSLFKYFFNLTEKKVGPEKAGEHFIAITDPGSHLEDLAKEFKFRHTFLNNPNLGGRYSALSDFGLVPAAFAGVDIKRLLERAQVTANLNGRETPVLLSDAATLGIIMGTAALAGRDKITFYISPDIESYGDWVEQLIAESTGKSGRGILPVVREKLGSPSVYGSDRLFVSIQFEGEMDPPEKGELVSAGHPWVSLTIKDKYDISELMLLWEMATAVAGHVIKIQAFNQPNVEAAKVIARRMVKAYSQQGRLPASETADFQVSSLIDFLKNVEPGRYVALHAYLTPQAETTRILQALRLKIRDQYKVATTLGYGPRFLHSTGQLHKGDGGNGLFIQFVSKAMQDADIPDEAGKDKSSISFGVLKQAEALGDAQALRDQKRKVISFAINESQVKTLKDWTEKL